MTARQVMAPSPHYLHPDDKISKGVQIVMKHRYRNLPVVDQNHCYLGIFGIHCLLKLVLPTAVLMERGLTTIPYVTEELRDLRLRLKDVEDKPVSSCMNQEATVVNPDTPLLETLLILYNTRTSIPVVDPKSRCLEGMISYWDVGAAILGEEV